VSSVSSLKNRVTDTINVQNFALLLLFLFPIGISFIRHWASGIFGLLFFTSIYYWVRYKTPRLVKEEKILLWLYLTYFLVFILTSLVNGWEKEQTVWLGLELRFLAFISMYLMIRQLSQASDTLYLGMRTGLVAVFVWGLYELYVIQNPAGITGTYGPLLIGPVTALFAILSLVYGLYHAKNAKDYLLPFVLFLLGLFVVINTTARSAYLAVLVAMVLLPVLIFTGKKRLLVFAAFFLIGITVLVYSNRVDNRATKAYDEFVAYMKEPHPENSPVATTSVGTRLEMLRSVKYFFHDSPVFGVGRGNYNKEVRKYIKEGKLNQSIANHSHPHNVFAETLISRGIIGLIVILLLMYFPLWIFWRSYHQSPVTAAVGILQIVMITVYSMTETATFVKGNFVAVNMIFIAVLFSSHLRRIGKISA
jgi:O-antigen ligase